MGLSENSDDHIYSKYKELCKDLNMDSNTTSVAWDSYVSIKQNYNLEGDQIHWLGCAIYVACRKAKTPTVGQTGSFVKGNCVSLTRLLRLCGLSLTQFFSKSKNWADMANMPLELRNKIDRLERNFNVSHVIFKKYHVIFIELFQSPFEDQPKQHRSRKQRNVPCTSSRIFEFVWTLFVAIKGEYASCSDDLVTSFHLLLACCDLAYNNVLLADRRDILNPNFSGLPENFHSPDYTKPSSPICIIDILCKMFDGIVKDAKWVKEYSWKQALSKLFEKGILTGDDNSYTGLFDASNYDNNVKAVNKLYEEHVLNVGEFDEKIFLAEYRRLQLISRTAGFNGTIQSSVNEINSDNNMNSKITSQDMQMMENQSLEQYENHTNQLIPQTPLTGRRYLSGYEQQKNAPLATATQSVIRLQTLLAGRLPEPSDMLGYMFKSCSTNPADNIRKIIDDMSETFRNEYTKATADQPAVSTEFANNRITLSQTLYYKLLENVLLDEIQKNPNLGLANLLQNQVFHQCMFACSIEIVIYSYNSRRNFPWILDALDIKAINFYKVIELIVRTKDQLSRDIVKHLSSIEEQVLESLAWRHDSPLWDTLKQMNDPIPSFEDSCLPGQLEEAKQPESAVNVAKIQTPTSTSVPQSPITTATERFQSPLASNLVKKKLFLDSTPKVKPGQSLLQNKAVLVVMDEKGNQKIVPLNDLQEAPASPTVTAPPKPKRQGPLALFFRKFYIMGGVRMKHLCDHLQLTDMSLKQKIFTCFEHTIVSNTDLMKDRHLDQILMCAIYVICKVSKIDRTFTEIMRWYRLQPQSDSHVYRSVLISKRKVDRPSDATEDSDTSNPSSKLVRPNEMAGTATTHDTEDRGDLINFYNQVYVPREQQFAMKFSGNQDDNLHLSPLPVSRPLSQVSPKRRVTDTVFVRPFEHSETQTNAKQYCYLFSRSPSKNLQNINQVVNSRVGKRLLTEDDSEEDVVPIKKAVPLMSRKLQGIIEERLGHSKE